MMRVAATLALASVLAAAAVAAPEGRDYDAAASCKALSLLATNVADANSQAALKLIDAEIDKKVAAGKTRAQADADIEYFRVDAKDYVSQSVIDAEWTKCVARWSAP